MEKSNKLLGHVAVVHRALYEIVALICSSTQPDDKTMADSTVHDTFTPVRGKLHSTAMSSTSNNSDKKTVAAGSNKDLSQRDHTSSTRTLSASNKHTNTMVHLTTPTHRLTQLTLSQLGSVGEQVLNHFCELVSEAVVKSVLQSHKRFIESLGADAVVYSKVVANSGAHQPQTHSVSDTEDNSPKEKGFQTAPTSIHIGGPQQTNSEAPKTQKNLSDSLSSPSLQLMVDVHFATPRIQLEPTLEKVHSDLLEVSESLLHVLHQLKWWASSSAGRTLYDVFGIGAQEEAMYNSIRSSMQCKSNDFCLTLAGKEVAVC